MSCALRKINKRTEPICNTNINNNHNNNNHSKIDITQSQLKLVPNIGETKLNKTFNSKVNKISHKQQVGLDSQARMVLHLLESPLVLSSDLFFLFRSEIILDVERLPDLLRSLSLDHVSNCLASQIQKALDVQVVSRLQMLTLVKPTLSKSKT